MTDPRYDKVITKAIALLLIAIIVLVGYKIQMKAFSLGMNGTVQSMVFALLGGCVTASIIVVRGWKKK